MKRKPRPFQDLSGKVLHDWTVVSPVREYSVRSDRTKRGYCTKWLCRCVCGKELVLSATMLNKGIQKSCGCKRANWVNMCGTLVRSADHPAYKSWVEMRQRCQNPKRRRYHRYGGRGITVCAEWEDSKVFLSDMLPTWKPGLTLERKDNNGNYNKDNCRWATRREQSRNFSANVIIETPSGPLCLMDAIAKYGKCAYATARTRISRGTMDAWRAVTTPSGLADRPKHAPCPPNT